MLHRTGVRLHRDIYGNSPTLLHCDNRCPKRSIRNISTRRNALYIQVVYAKQFSRCAAPKSRCLRQWYGSLLTAVAARNSHKYRLRQPMKSLLPVYDAIRHVHVFWLTGFQGCCQHLHALHVMEPHQTFLFLKDVMAPLTRLQGCCALNTVFVAPIPSHGLQALYP